MAHLDDHFGDHADLDEPTRKDIQDYLSAHSAEHSDAIISKRILASIAPDITPLRITETRYFRRAHGELKPSVFKRKSIGSPSNCGACHTTALQGIYDEEKVRIPRP
jgi:hypothetical protein